MGSGNTPGGGNMCLENWFKGKIDELDVHGYYLQIVHVIASGVAVFAYTYPQTKNAAPPCGTFIY